MTLSLSERSEHLSRVASLKSVKGRRQQGRFAFEGVTLVREAIAAGVEIETVYATQAALDAGAAASLGDDVPVYVVPEKGFARLSDVETPSGLLAVSPIRLTPLPDAFRGGETVVVLAGLNDPGNAGTLLRSAEAFGTGGAVFGAGGVDPFSPKIVRAAMGSFFRLRIAVATPEEFGAAAGAADYRVVGLEAGAAPIRDATRTPRTAIVVGHERRGLAEWRGVCGEFAGIPIAATAESLNAGVAGAIALYELARAASKSGP